MKSSNVNFIALLTVLFLGSQSFVAQKAEAFAGSTVGTTVGGALTYGFGMGYKAAAGVSTIASVVVQISIYSVNGLAQQRELEEYDRELKILQDDALLYLSEGHITNTLDEAVHSVWAHEELSEYELSVEQIATILLGWN